VRGRGGEPVLGRRRLRWWELSEGFGLGEGVVCGGWCWLLVRRRASSPTVEVESVEVVGGSRGLVLATRTAESVFSSAWLIWCRLPEGGVGRSSSSVRSMVVR
jgi:hypothetical protein